MKYKWVVGDYSQAENRIVAWAGPVPKMKAWFNEGTDVHIEVARAIARVVQENRVSLPGKLFSRKPWQQLAKSDEPERQYGKTTGHSNNYGLGVETFALFLKMPVRYAKLIQAIYHTQFPQIKQGYQKWIEEQLGKSRTIVTAMGRPKVFYGLYGADMFRAGYAYYPQSTVGDMITDTIVKVSECFEEVKFVEGRVWTPGAIRACGLNFKYNGHDAVGVIVPDSEETINFAASTLIKAANIPLAIRGETLTIPMDVKVGPSLGDLVKWSS